MSSEVPAELRSLEWLPPWEPTDEDFGVELAREVGPGHPLFDRPTVAVARRVDCDDVLFWLPAGPAALAVVHLTWRGNESARRNGQGRGCTPQWPSGSNKGCVPIMPNMGASSTALAPSDPATTP